MRKSRKRRPRQRPPPLRLPQRLLPRPVLRRRLARPLLPVRRARPPLLPRRPAGRRRRRSERPLRRGLALECGGFEVPIILAARSCRNLKSKNHTRIITLLVSLMIPKFVPSVLHNETNFGIGTLAPSVPANAANARAQGVRAPDAGNHGTVLEI